MQPIPPAPISARHNPAKPPRTLLPVFFYFVAAGIATVMLGPLLPALIQRWHIQDAQAGTLFTASFVGQFCGAWFATRNLRASVLYGSAISAAGCAAMAWAGFDAAHIALFFVGLGLGAGLTAGNVIAGTAVPPSRARLIAILNVAWGIGAIACPVLVRLSSAGGIQHFFFATAIFSPSPRSSPSPSYRSRATRQIPNRRSCSAIVTHVNRLRAFPCRRYLSLSSAPPSSSTSASKTRLAAGCPATPFAPIPRSMPRPSPSTSG